MLSEQKSGCLGYLAVPTSYTILKIAGRLPRLHKHRMNEKLKYKTVFHCLVLFLLLKYLEEAGNSAFRISRKKR